MKFFMITLFVLVFLVGFCGCNDNNISNSSQNGQSSILYKDKPCHEGLEKDSSDEAESEDVTFTWTLDNYKLNIELKHNVTCGSAFADSITYLDNILSVNLKDTSSVHFRCICKHGSQVELNIGTERQIRFLFSVMGYSHNEYSLEVDTLLTIR